MSTFISVHICQYLPIHVPVHRVGESLPLGVMQLLYSSALTRTGSVIRTFDLLSMIQSWGMLFAKMPQISEMKKLWKYSAKQAAKIQACNEPEWGFSRVKSGPNAVVEMLAVT